MTSGPGVALMTMMMTMAMIMMMRMMIIIVTNTITMDDDHHRYQHHHRQHHHLLPLRPKCLASCLVGNLARIPVHTTLAKTRASANSPLANQDM
jgi:hypothetical protein